MIAAQGERLTGEVLRDTLAGRAVAAARWEGTPLGPIASWPASLVAVADTVLASPTPMILAWGADHTIFYNDACLALLGIGDFCIGRPLALVAGTSWERLRPLLVATMHGHPPPLVAREFYLGGGGLSAEGWLVAACSPVPGDEGRVAGALCVITDVTDRVMAERARDRAVDDLRAAEESVHRLQKVETVGHAVAGVVHDLNNMLAVVVGALELMRRGVDPSERRLARYIEAADDGATRAAALIHRLLAFSRRSPVETSPIDANSIVAGIVGLLRILLGERVTLRADCDGDLWPTVAEVGRLENVIVNLAINARDAMPDGGEVTIGTRNAALDDAAAAEWGARAGEYVLVSVTDTGSGMTSEVVRKAFDPFFTTKPVGDGTGLGLSQVADFARSFGGYVALRSEVGVGTTVEIYLPRSTGIVADEARSGEAASVPSAHASAPVVEAQGEPRRVAHSSGHGPVSDGRRRASLPPRRR